MFIYFTDLKPRYGNMSEVALVTLAPELDNCLDVVQHLVSKGIKVSIGTQKIIQKKMLHE